MKNIVTSVILMVSLFLSACVVVLDETPAQRVYYQQPYHNTYIVEQSRYCSTVYGYADVYRSHGNTVRYGQARIQC